MTAYDQPALGGVYKLAAIRGGDGGWRHVLKVSEQPFVVLGHAFPTIEPRAPRATRDRLARPVRIHTRDDWTTAPDLVDGDGERAPPLFACQ